MKGMKDRYIVRFEYMNESGEWKEDHFSNDGDGWTAQDAEQITEQLKRENVRNIKIEAIRKNW